MLLHQTKQFNIVLLKYIILNVG